MGRAVAGHTAGLPATDAAGVLARLFPPFVATALAPVGDEVPCSHPQERAALAGAGPERRRQYLAGRACAHVALRAIGRDGLPLGRGSLGQPLWPPGAVGSISHTPDLAGAVAARTGDAWGLGFDLELLEPPLDAAVRRLVLRPDELARRAASHPLDPHRAKIAFCVKECAYKCLSPGTRWPLDFHDLTVDVDLRRCRCRVVVDDRFRLGGLPLRPLDVRFAVVAGYVLAGLWVGSGGPPVCGDGRVTG
ncbi:MAG TPA: 4'-phosphopantetheinyl transferase superfamily protein [Egibacteraceae bacterium]|nr:4'-phosphopantetheinyl transferase superfamily protein [Egibacteraceae bacterium]